MPPSLQSLLNSRFPAVMIALGAALALLALGKKLFDKWKAWRATKSGAAPKPAETAAAPMPAASVGKNALARIYEDFIDDLPSAYKRSTTAFQPILVLGSAGSGQSELITRFAAWERQSKAFIPSSVTEADLRIYMGSHAIVHELSPSIFEDTSKDARVALERLCTPLYKVRRPIVVFTLDATEVLEGNPSELAGTADLLRGKLHLLSQLHPREGVEVRVALTHMERIPGFSAFSVFAKAARFPTVLRFERGAVSEKALRAQIDTLETALPLALVRCDAPTYLQILELMRVLPRLADRLVACLQQIAAPIGTANPPHLSELHLVGPEGSAANPFHVSDADLAVPDRTPLRRHAAVAGALAGALCIYLGVALSSELSLFADADASLDEARASTLPLNLERSEKLVEERVWRGHVMAVLHRHESWLRYFPDFVRAPFGRDEASAAMAATLSRMIESRILLPQMTRLRDPSQVHRRGPRALYLVAILRGNTLGPASQQRASRGGTAVITPDKGMGRLIEGEIGEWAMATGLPAELIRDYLELTPDLYDIERIRRAIPADATNTPALKWNELLRDVEALLSRGSVRADELEPIRENAAHCLPYVRALSEFPELDRITEILKSQTGAADLVTLAGYDHVEQIEMARWASQPGGVTTLELLAASNLGPRDPTTARALHDDAPLTNLPGLTSALWAAKNDAPSTTAARTPAPAVRLVTQPFRREAWLSILLKSRVQVEIDSFVGSHSPSEHVFFSNVSIPLSSLDDSPFFSTPSPINPRYTKAAFDRNVRASVLELDAIIRALEFRSEDPVLDALNRFVEASMNAYAARYAAENMRQLDSFGVHGLDSVESLRVVLGQMSSDGSPLDQILSGVVINTRLAIPEAELARFAPTTTSLGRFVPLHALIGPDGRPTPALQSYKQILAGAMASLDAGPAPAAGAAPPGATADFTPVGMLALGQLHEDPASFVVLVRQWANGLGLSAQQRRPFLEPLRGIERVGVDDIQFQSEDEWNEEVEPPLDALLELYPFDHTAVAEATPQQITAVLHPTDGSLARYIAAYVAPVSLRRRDGTWRPRPTRDGGTLSRRVYARINAAIAVSRTLFDENGAPRPLHVTIVPQLLETVRDHGPSVTLGYLRSGETTVFAFNQRESEVDITLDWSQRTAAQVGVQLQAPGTDSVAPRPVETRGYFALLRLLDRAERVGDRCTFTIGRNRTRVDFVVTSDPTPLLRRLAVR